MKNISYIIIGLLAIAIAILYYLHFSNSSSQNKSSASTDSTGIATANTSGQAVVFINSDSLLTNYSYFKKIRKDMEQKTKNAESDLMRRQKALEAELRKYQETGGAMSMEQRQRAEESLQKKDMELRSYGQTLSQSLQMEEAKQTEDLFNKLSDYLKVHAKGKPYQYVLSYSKQSNILFANDSLDITKEVLKGLNASEK